MSEAVPTFKPGPNWPYELPADFLCPKCSIPIISWTRVDDINTWAKYKAICWNCGNTFLFNMEEP